MKDHLKMKLGVDVKSTRDDIKFLMIELKNKIIETKNGIDIDDIYDFMFADCLLRGQSNYI